MNPIPFPNKKYQIIYADPPWAGPRFNFWGQRPHNTPLHLRYETMETAAICDLPVKDITEKDAILFLWTTDARLTDALEVIKAWGFTYRTIGFIWNKKESTGKQVCFMSRWTMKGSEICLLATKGKPYNLIKSHKVRQLVEAQRRGHSQKPGILRDKIVELLGDIPRIELFAREKAEGWDSWGDGI